MRISALALLATLLVVCGCSHRHQAPVPVVSIWWASTSRDVCRGCEPVPWIAEDESPKTWYILKAAPMSLRGSHVDSAQIDETFGADPPRHLRGVFLDLTPEGEDALTEFQSGGWTGVALVGLNEVVVGETLISAPSDRLYVFGFTSRSAVAELLSAIGLHIDQAPATRVQRHVPPFNSPAHAVLFVLQHTPATLRFCGGADRCG